MNHIKTNRSEHTLTITIDRPEALNALNRQVVDGLLETFSSISPKDGIRCVILTGSGDKAFVAGADLKEMRHLSPKQAAEFSALGHKLGDVIENLPIPVIAAVNGFALGGGLELALICDFIYASDNAVLGLVETKLGLIPGFGGNARLSRRIGAARAKEMIFKAEQLSANNALKLGLVNHVSEAGHLMSDVQKCAASISKCGPYANGLVKEVMLAGMDLDQRQANRLETQAFGLVFASKDHAEGMDSFLEKRRAQYSGE